MTTVHTAQTRPVRQDNLLRLALRLDAVASGTMGVGFVAGGTWLDGVLGIPTGWLVTLGAVLVGYAGALVWLATRPVIPVGPTRTVIVGNVIWALVSGAVVLQDWFALTGIGVALVLAQALAVFGFADLQYLGLRRLR